MNKMKKYCLIIGGIIFFLLISLLFCNWIISRIFNNNSVSTKIDSSSIDSSASRYIPNNVVKIKISKFDTTDELPFICYISDTTQIEDFIKPFDTIKLTEDNSIAAFTPLYIIEFNGKDNATIQISSDKILKVDSLSNKYFKLSDTDFQNISNLTDIKYFLHDSNLEIPSATTCYHAKEKMLNGLTDSEINTLKSQIHNIHMELEFYLVDSVNILKNSNSIYWEPAVVDEVFTQPDGTKFQSYGFWQYRNNLQNVSKLNLNDNLQNVINDILYHLQCGMDNCDLSECYESHKILHDLDYWIINYPIDSFIASPIDWGGVNCYYGLIEEYSL